MILIEKIINGKFYLSDNEKYFFVYLDNICYAVPDSCPHRYGPLSLGKLCQVTDTIKCPWHESKIKIKSLIKKSLIGIKVGDNIIIYT